MQAAMENYNKRKAEDAGLPAQGGAKSTIAPARRPQKFWLPLAFDGGKPFDIIHAVNWTGKKLPSLVRSGFVPKPNDTKFNTLSFSSPMVATKFCDLGPRGDIGKFGKVETNAKFNLSIVDELPDRFNTPSNKKRAEDFTAWLHATVDSMITSGWDAEGVWEKHKKTAVKEAKKEAKKDNGRTAKEIFVANATTALFKTYEERETEEDKPRYEFTTKYQIGMPPRVNRPVFWKPTRNQMGEVDVKNVTDTLPSKKNGLHQGSVIKFGFDLEAYDTDTMYGVKAKLKPNVLCVYLPKRKERSMQDMMGDATEYISDNDEY